MKNWKQYICWHGCTGVFEPAFWRHSSVCQEQYNIYTDAWEQHNIYTDAWKQKTLCFTLVTSDVTHSTHSTHSIRSQNCVCSPIFLLLLGFYLYFDLSFKEHIRKIYEKVNKYVEFCTMYNTSCRQGAGEYYTFHSYLAISNIGIEIYGNVSNAISKPLQLVQSRLLRALQYKDKYFSINLMHKSYGILKIPDIVQ